MHRRSFLTASAAAALLGARPLFAASSGTLVVLRHADRDGPDLNATGRARAAALPAALTGIAIDAIFSPDLERNIDTVTPLAQERGLQVNTIEPTNIAVKMFSGRAGQTLVWVGNKQNLEQLWEDIGAMGAPPLNYGDLFIVRVSAGRAISVDRRHYGP